MKINDVVQLIEAGHCAAMPTWHFHWLHSALLASQLPDTNAIGPGAVHPSIPLDPVLDSAKVVQEWTFAKSTTVLNQPFFLFKVCKITRHCNPELYLLDWRTLTSVLDDDVTHTLASHGELPLHIRFNPDSRFHPNLALLKEEESEVCALHYSKNWVWFLMALGRTPRLHSKINMPSGCRVTCIEWPFISHSVPSRQGSQPPHFFFLPTKHGKFTDRVYSVLTSWYMTETPFIN